MEEQKKRILKLVEEGKLSAEEALTLLESLESEERQKINKVTALSTEVLESDSDYRGKQTVDKQSSLGAKLMDWVDTAVKKVKEIDLDLNFGKSIDVKHIFQFKEAAFSDIDLSLPNGSVNLQPWDEKDIRVECDAKVYRVENVEQARELFLSEVECLAEGNKFSFHTDKKTMKLNLVVYVPDQIYERIKIKLFNGPIRGENLKVDHLKAKTANGVVSFSDIAAHTGEVETANGQIKVSHSTFDKLEVESISGLIQITGTAGKLDAQSFNGNVLITLTHPTCDTLYAKTTTGNIDITIPKRCTVVGELKSNLGTLSAQLEDAMITFEKNEAIQKELKFKTSQEARLSLFADSKTGSITVK